MTSTDNSPSGEGLSAIVQEAKQVLSDLQGMKVRSDELLQATETARKNADSEGLFAVNAKKTCEEHATAISQIKATVEVDVNTVVTNKQKTDELLAAINVGKAAVDGDVKTISDHRREIDASAQKIIDAANVGSSHLQRVIEVKESVDATLKAIEEQQQMAQNAQAKAVTAQGQTEKHAEAVRVLLVATTASHKTSTDNQSEIERLLTDAKGSEASLREVLESLAKSNDTAAAFEARVKASATELEALIKQTEGLLPGVTSASLASAFGQQKARFSTPKKYWMFTFVGCIGLLVLLAVPSYQAALSSNAPETWAEIVRSLAMRVPIIAPLVWLGIYAGRNYMLSIRLEEDYAYKEAISISFEGYKREMEKIAPGDGNTITPLNTLCGNVLTAMADRPGRIYEGKPQDITPMNEALLAIGKTVDAAKRQIAAG